MKANEYYSDEVIFFLNKYIMKWLSNISGYDIRYFNFTELNTSQMVKLLRQVTQNKLSVHLLFNFIGCLKGKTFNFDFIKSYSLDLVEQNEFETFFHSINL